MNTLLIQTLRLGLICFLLQLPGLALAQESFPEEIQKIHYEASIDKTQQPALFYKPEGNGPFPLLVILHSWSGNWLQTSNIPLMKHAIEKKWIMVHPDFRGANRNPKAGGSKYAVQDVIDSVKYAKTQAPVDSSKVYLVGVSGGGHMALQMAGLAPDLWSRVSAWVPISDMTRWYHETKKAGIKYTKEIVACCGGIPGASEAVDREYRYRSPLTHLKAAKGIPIDIQAGITDGHTGSVPIRHTLLAFNELAEDKDRLSLKLIEEFTEIPKVPISLLKPDLPSDDYGYGKKKPLFRRESGNVRVTIFDGGHEILHAAALEWLSRSSKESKPKKSSPKSTWTQWRGPQGSGFSPTANPPVTWSENKNIRWKTPIPGRGHSSPVIWDNLLFITTAVPHGPQLPPVPVTAPGAHDNVDVTQRHQFRVLALNRDTGDSVWNKQVHETLPHEGGHYTGSLASGSPVVDKDRVYAFFGSHGLYALNHKGDLVWKRNLGKQHSKHAHGEGSSPALKDGLIVVNWDHEGQSFVEAMHSHNGKTKWKKPRDEPTSWSSPIIIEYQGKKQVVVNGTNKVRGYDFDNGDVLWSCGGLSANVVATPIFNKGVIYSGSSYNIRAFLAIKLDGAKGDITTSPNVLWRRSQRTPYVPSPLLYGDALYFMRHYQAVLCRVNTDTGLEPTGPFRLRGVRNIYASPVGASGRIYITDTEGKTIVLTAGPSPQTLALNHLDDSFSASAAIIDNEMFLRGLRFVYCIAEE